MKKFQMPSSYAAIPSEEQQQICGGGEFQESVNNFFGSLHLDDFFYGGGLISFSVSFVPMLLFRMVDLGVKTGIALYNQVSRLLDQILHAGTSAIHSLNAPQQSTQPQTNSLSTFPGLLK